jgi:hypothetical protein
MRLFILLAAAAALACAGLPPAPEGRAVRITDDGRTASAGGTTWRASRGISFFQRDDVLHVVSLTPGHVFDVTAAAGEQGLVGPGAEAPFEVVDGEVRIRPAPPSDVAALAASGQLYRHDDHFHLTHLYQNDDWQTLYWLRTDGSPVAPFRKQLAAAVLAALVDVKIPGSSEDATRRSLRRLDGAVGKARRAVEAEAPAKQIVGMALHDFEIGGGGKVLSVEERTYEAEGGVRFAYCGDHVHVENPGAGWSHAIHLDDAVPGAFELPPSIFYEVRDGRVSERTGQAWRDLVTRGQIRLVGDAWFISEDYPSPAVAELKHAEADRALPSSAREAARVALVELLKLKVEIGSDGDFQARLGAIELSAAQRWREVQAEMARAILPGERLPRKKAPPPAPAPSAAPPGK